jgi:Flp pilus assembly protein TadD
MTIESIIAEIESAKKKNNYPKARKMALEAIHDYTDDYRLYEELADIHLFEGHIDDAKEVLSVARELHPKSTTGMYLSGYIATIQGEFDEAIEILTEANTSIPNNAEILRNLGWAHVMQGETMKGISILKRARSLSPEEPLIVHDLSIALMSVGEVEEARALLESIGQWDAIDMEYAHPDVIAALKSAS